MEVPCWLCDIRPVESKKRPLCHSCYTLCHARRLLHIFPLISDNNRKVISAIDKYGNELKTDMDLLDKGETILSVVGTKYHLSKERIRQLFPIFFNKSYTDVLQTRGTITPGQTYDKETARKISESIIESKLLRLRKDTAQYIGAVTENIFLQKCVAMGYNIKMHGGIIDATVNGFLVEVKSRAMAIGRTSNRSCGQLNYLFHARKNQVDIADFFACFLIDANIWYIIPKTILTRGNNCRLSIAIPKYDLEYKGRHKYKDMQQYREAWHLLRSNEGLVDKEKEQLK